MTITGDMSAAKRRLLQKMLAGEATLPMPERAAVVPRPPNLAAPISIEQRQVWLHAAIFPDLPLYNEPITIHRKGPLDLAALQASFDEILLRHEIWRTSFAFVDDDIVQVVHPARRLSLPLVDLTGLPAAERDAEALRLATADARRPFDLAIAPLLRALVIKLAPDEHRIYLTLHHIIFDGVSIYRILMPELARCYAAFARTRPPSAPASVLQYGDYALWREHMAASAVVARQIDYWRETFAGETVPALRLPADRPRRAPPSYHGGMETFALSAALSEAMKTLSRKEGVTLYATLLAAFKALLHRETGQDDLVVGGVVDMRRRPELEPVMGYFLNTLALRTRPSGNITFRAYLKEVQRAVIEALCASDIPFDRVVHEVLPGRDLYRQPLFSALFSIEPPAEAFADGWDLTQMDVSVGTSKFDLYLELDERPDGLIGRFFYSTDLFEARTIERMIGHWIALLEAVAADPDSLLSCLPGGIAPASVAAPAVRSTRELETTGAPPAPSAPASAVRRAEERRMAAIWRQLLRVSDIAATDDFFALGGSSWLLAKLLVRIESEFGRTLPMAAVFQAPTLEKMAALLGEAAPAGSRNARVQPGRPTMLWLRAGPNFRSLAEAMAPDWPFFSVDLEGPDLPAQSGDASLTEIAAATVRRIRAIQPDGPYLLGGWCAAGILAYEVASQLTRSGERVDLLALIHAGNPARVREISPLALEASKLKHHARQVFMRRKGDESWGYAVACVERGFGRVADWRRKIARAPRPLDMGELIDRAVLDYEPKAYDGDVVLFQPAERPDVLDYLPGWRDVVTGKLVAYEIPGDHHTLFRTEYVGQLGTLLGACLREAVRRRVDGRAATAP